MKNLFLIIFLIFISSCSQTGWRGYYSFSDPKKLYKYDKYKYPESYEQEGGVISIGNEKISLLLPSACSGFALSGLFTPFTPPIPVFWFRSWSTNDCNYFGIISGNFDSKSSNYRRNELDLKISLNYQGKIYEPTILKKEGWLYTFPILAKNIDSGSIIIEKNGEKIEVPFEYKYLKFWY